VAGVELPSFSARLFCCAVLLAWFWWLVALLCHYVGSCRVSLHRSVTVSLPQTYPGTFGTVAHAEIPVIEASGPHVDRQLFDLQKVLLSEMKTNENCLAHVQEKVKWIMPQYGAHVGCLSPFPWPLSP